MWDSTYTYAHLPNAELSSVCPQTCFYAVLKTEPNTMYARQTLYQLRYILSSLIWFFAIDFYAINRNSYHCAYLMNNKKESGQNKD